jgi:hypothetical protein
LLTRQGCLVVIREGGTLTVDQSGNILRYDGTAWSTPLPFSVLDSLSAAPDGSLWAAGGPQCQDRGGSLRPVLHWNGSSWTALSYHGNSGEADSIAPDGSGGVWISTTVGLPGSGVMLHLTGGAIVPSALPDIDGASPRVSLAAAPGGGPVYGVGAYFAFPHNMTAVGAVIIEQR